MNDIIGALERLKVALIQHGIIPDEMGIVLPGREIQRLELICASYLNVYRTEKQRGKSTLMGVELIFREKISGNPAPKYMPDEFEGY